MVIIHKACWNRMYFPGIYHLVDQSWRGKENEIALCRSGPTVVVDRMLCMLDQSLGTKLMIWLNETKELVMVGRLSDKPRPPCELEAGSRKIYVIGRGLSTVTIDMDTVASVDGFLVSSSTGPLMEHDFLLKKCRVITI
uniref:Uncharacterized protein n=2 Tax=Aegilops tauschii TaxID=37682 RepID=A0A453MUZ5_AEGTS